MTAPMRPRLSEMQGLSLNGQTILPNPVELSRWSEEGLIEIDTANSCFRLTEAGRLRLRDCCANCKWWRILPVVDAGGSIGECHESERLPEGLGVLRPAITLYYRACEMFEATP